MVLKLEEYHRNGNYQTAGNVFTFDPQPRNIKKAVSVKWRIRRPGFEKKIERARFRYNEKITYSITGSCVADKRDEIEWYAKRDAIFKLLNCTLKTYHSQETDDQGPGTPDTYTSAKAQGEETVFVVFESCSFTRTEAKVNWYDYTIKLRRVHQTRH